MTVASPVGKLNTEQPSPSPVIRLKRKRKNQMIELSDIRTPENSMVKKYEPKQADTNLEPPAPLQSNQTVGGDLSNLDPSPVIKARTRRIKERSMHMSAMEVTFEDTAEISATAQVNSSTSYGVNNIAESSNQTKGRSEDNSGLEPSPEIKQMKGRKRERSIHKSAMEMTITNSQDVSEATGEAEYSKTSLNQSSTKHFKLANKSANMSVDKSAIKSAKKSTDKLLSNRSIGENGSIGVSPSPAIRVKKSRLRVDLVNLSVSAVASPGAEPIENLASNKTSNASTAKQDITQVLDVELSTAADSSDVKRSLPSRVRRMEKKKKMLEDFDLSNLSQQSLVQIGSISIPSILKNSLDDEDDTLLPDEEESQLSNSTRNKTHPSQPILDATLPSIQEDIQSALKERNYASLAENVSSNKADNVDEKVLKSAALSLRRSGGARLVEQGKSRVEELIYSPIINTPSPSIRQLGMKENIPELGEELENQEMEEEEENDKLALLEETKAKRGARKSTVNGPLVRVPDLSNIAEAMESQSHVLDPSKSSGLFRVPTPPDQDSLLKKSTRSPRETVGMTESPGVRRSREIILRRESRKSIYQAGLEEYPRELENTRSFSPNVESTRIGNMTGLLDISPVTPGVHVEQRRTRVGGTPGSVYKSGGMNTSTPREDILAESVSSRTRESLATSLTRSRTQSSLKRQKSSTDTQAVTPTQKEGNSSITVSRQRALMSKSSGAEMILPQTQTMRNTSLNPALPFHMRQLGGDYTTPEFIRRAKRMSSMGVPAVHSLYQSRIYMDMIAEGGTQTTPTICTLNETEEKIEQVLLRNLYKMSTTTSVQVTPGLNHPGLVKIKKTVHSAGNSPIVWSTQTSPASGPNSGSKNATPFPGSSSSATRVSGGKSSKQSSNILETTNLNLESLSSRELESLALLAEEDIQEFKDQYCKLEELEKQMMRKRMEESQGVDGSVEEMVDKEIQLVRRQKELISDILATGKIPLNRSNTSNNPNGIEEDARYNEDGETPKEDQNKSGTLNLTKKPFELQDRQMPEVMNDMVNLSTNGLQILPGHSLNNEEEVDQFSDRSSELEHQNQGELEEADEEVDADEKEDDHDAIEEEEEVEEEEDLKDSFAVSEGEEEGEDEQEVEDQDKDLEEADEEVDAEEKEDDHDAIEEEVEEEKDLNDSSAVSEGKEEDEYEQDKDLDADNDIIEPPEQAQSANDDEEYSAEEIVDHQQVGNISPDMIYGSRTQLQEGSRRNLSRILDSEDNRAKSTKGNRVFLIGREKKEMRQATLERYLGPSTSRQILTGLTFLNTPEPAPKPVKSKPTKPKPKPGVKSIYPMRFHKFEFLKHSNHKMKKEAEEPLMEASEAFNKMVRVRASQLARERGDKVIRLSDLRQVMGETGLVKPLSEDPDNTYLYRDLRDQHWDRFKALIPVRKAGILTPDPSIWMPMIIGKKRKLTKKVSASSIKRFKVMRSLDEDENEDEDEDEPEEGGVDTAADVEDDEGEMDDLEPEPVKQTKSVNRKKSNPKDLSGKKSSAGKKSGKENAMIASERESSSGKVEKGKTSDKKATNVKNSNKQSSRKKSEESGNKSEKEKVSDVETTRKPSDDLSSKINKQELTAKSLKGRKVRQR
ncbi:nucleoprotein TPR isoform X6 [Eurytemora carolleeae]|nr:nucleoprotein TPR isoform X6 [Eurytemora carolleeae]|eukprot:XP_023337096.1 nucleoprotein TPR-like isoform X6 [Eurytemora affinis]